MVDENKILIIINEFEGINEIDFGNLTYIYKKFGEIDDDDFELDFYGFRSLKIESKIDSLIEQGLINNSTESFRTFSVTEEGRKRISTPEKVQIISKKIKEKKVTPFELAIYCGMKEVYSEDKLPKKARMQGINEDKIKQIESVLALI